MKQKLITAMSSWFLCMVFIACLALPAAAVVETFGTVPAGTVVAGQKPGGGYSPGTIFAPLTLSVINNGGGPQSLIIFDSSNPTGNDPDLGTPNETFGGPGIGYGGQAGHPGANWVSYGNLLIVAEDIVDSNGDGLVDDPDDEEGGGVIQFLDFSEPVVVNSIVLVDIDYNEWATIECYSDSALVGTTNAAPLGNNSVQEIDLSVHGIVTRLVVTLSSSGAIAQIDYQGDVATEESSWGRIKRLFR